MYSVKQVTFDYTVTSADLFSTTTVPQPILQSGGGTIITPGGGQVQITGNVLTYLITMRDELAVYSNVTTVTIPEAAAINPVTNTVATVNEFNVYINGQYVDKVCYTWTPDNTTTQTIVFDTTALGYNIDSQDVVIVNGRWQ